MNKLLETVKVYDGQRSNSFRVGPGPGKFWKKYSLTIGLWKSFGFFLDIPLLERKLSFVLAFCCPVNSIKNADFSLQ